MLPPELRTLDAAAVQRRVTRLRALRACARAVVLLAVELPAPSAEQAAALAELAR